MKKGLYIALFAILTMCNACSSGDATAYKDLVFGMSVEEVKAKGYCDDKIIRTEDGMKVYLCKDKDFADIYYEKAELSFREDKLASVHFYNSTYDAEYQREISKKVTDYLTSQYGTPQTVNKCEGWKDDKKTFILYIHVDITELTPKYINELAILSNEYYKK